MTENVLALDAVAPLHGSAAAAVTFRWRGQLHVTVIAKASFAFAKDTAMPRIEPQPVIAAEVHHGKNPTRSVRFTSDLAPRLERADVLFTGCAEVAAGAPVQSMGVRVAVYDQQRSLLDKRLVVQDQAGFRRIPLVYEQASRGVGGLSNPFGLDPSAGPPHILDPARPDHPAGFGPIARTWPARKRLLGATPRKALDAAVAEIPEGFDWAYYQAAPLDQRTDFLTGEEWILLEGLHPTLPLLQTRLPSARASARIFGLAGMPEGHRLELRADLLHIDGDEQRCTVVWRQSFPVGSTADLRALRIAAGVEMAEETLPWPDPRVAWPVTTLSNNAVDDTAATLVVRGGSAETVALAFEPQRSRSGSTLPFRPSSEGGVGPSAATSERAPVVSTDTIALAAEPMPSSAPPSALPWGTLAVTPQASAAPRERALPFRAPSPDAAPAISRSALPQERMATDTLAIPHEEDHHLSGRSALPFSSMNKAPPPAAPPREDAPSAAIPLPESPSNAAPESANLAVPEPLAPPESPASARVEAAPAISPWAPAPPVPSEPPTPPPTAPPAASPVSRQSLYGRFGRKG